jgi:hypothetical protein
MNTNPHSPDDNSRDAAPERIARLLTRAAQQLDDDTVAALHRARQRALARHAVRLPVFALDTGHGLHLPIPHTPRQWMVAAILLAALAGSIGYWHHAREHEASHLDIAILTDDLPMEVFIDR